MDLLDVYRKDRAVFSDKLQSLDVICERPEVIFGEKAIRARVDEEVRDDLTNLAVVAYAAYNAADTNFVMKAIEVSNMRTRLLATRQRDRQRFYATFYNTINHRKKRK